MNFKSVEEREERIKLALRSIGDILVPKYDADWMPSGYVRGEDGLLYPSEFLQLSVAEKDRICNGVGGGEFAKYIPDTIWGLNVAKSADGHDFSYDKGGWEVEREIADKVFYFNLITQINGSFALLRPVRKIRARTYYRIVRGVGYFFFNYKR